MYYHKRAGFSCRSQMGKGGSRSTASGLPKRPNTSTSRTEGRGMGDAMIFRSLGRRDDRWCMRDCREMREDKSVVVRVVGMSSSWRGG